MFFQLRKWFTLLFLTFPLSLGVFSPSHKNSQKRKQKLIFFLLKKTTALHHVLSELLSTFYPCQISLSANSLPSLTFTVFNLDHLWLPPPPVLLSPQPKQIFLLLRITQRMCSSEVCFYLSLKVASFSPCLHFDWMKIVKKKNKIEPLLLQSPFPPEIPDLLKWAHWSQVYNIYLKQEIGLYDCRTVSWAMSPPSFSCSFSVVSYMRNSRVPSGRHGSPSVRHTASRSAQCCSGRVHHPLSSSSAAGHAWQDQRGAFPWVSSQTSGTVLLFSVCRVSAVWYCLSFHAYGKKMDFL